MKIARLFGAAAAAVMTTGALVAVAVPASGQDLLNPDIVPAMQRDLGLTHDQVLTRLKNEDVANKVTEAVRAALGDAFGGATYNAATGKAHVLTTNAAAVGKIREAGAEAEVVKFSARQLDSTVDTLNRAEKAAPAAVTGWGVDSATNRVTVSIVAGQRGAAGAFLAKSGVDTAAVTIVETAAQPSLYANIRGGDAYYIGGSSRCSVGFSTTTGFLTAGHCAALTGGGSLTGSNGASLGSWGRYSFPTNDYAAVRTNSNWTPLAQMNNGTAVRGSSNAATGTSVCKAGSTTGWTCGTIGAKNQTVRYSEGTVYGMTATNVRSAAGDSGGGFIAGNYAQGVLSGGNTTVTYFFPIGAALSGTGTTLKTS
ncbi:S1 family peptidase [Amycolatopsis australiensis]|uniref:Streptogrisin C n=1 Tax=Amycolatopsis australiensis TaxID=546364 RepID=A0A1K1PSY5_9PSEU|nr:S1 family peptidase [Amycolatopsis australiensis]SFW50581.1 streptogrisin C [Amycolatopsis australiensis]